MVTGTRRKDDSGTVDLFQCPCPGWKVPATFPLHLPLQQESRGWCFSQPWCVCEGGGRSLWGSGAAPHRSQLCQTPPGSSLPGRPRPLQLQVAEATFCHALCQTGTYGEGREGTLPSGKQTAVHLCVWGTKEPSWDIPGHANIHRYTHSFCSLLIFAPARELKKNLRSLSAYFFIFFQQIFWAGGDPAPQTHS